MEYEGMETHTHVVVELATAKKIKRIAAATDECMWQVVKRLADEEWVKVKDMGEEKDHGQS